MFGFDGGGAGRCHYQNSLMIDYQFYIRSRSQISTLDNVSSRKVGSWREILAEEIIFAGLAAAKPH